MLVRDALPSEPLGLRKRERVPRERERIEREFNYDEVDG